MLNRFHGLATEFTIPAITAFIQKLLADQEVMQFCGPWFKKVSAPHTFIELLYGIGFVGIKNGQDLEFRGVGTRAASPPPISATSTVVVHPSYAPALDLQSKLIGDLDDVVLQKEGLLLELPEAIDLNQYQQILTTLLSDIDTTPHGRDHDSAYEDVVGRMIQYCFFRWLNNVEPRSRDLEGRVIRDWIAANVADQGFWSMIRDKYGSNQVVWECKNYIDLSADDFHQVSYYMNDAIGRFVVICYRGPDIKPHYIQHIRKIHTDNHGMVILLNDKDLKTFIRQAMNQKVKEDHIREIFDQLVRKIG